MVGKPDPFTFKMDLHNTWLVNIQACFFCSDAYLIPLGRWLKILYRLGGGTGIWGYRRQHSEASYRP